jgi:hypothetical protein
VKGLNSIMTLFWCPYFVKFVVCTIIIPYVKLCESATVYMYQESPYSVVWMSWIIYAVYYMKSILMVVCLFSYVSWVFTEVKINVVLYVGISHKQSDRYSLKCYRETGRKVNMPIL